MTIGERIKEKRLEKKMSLDDLAKIAHVARQTIYKYENNIVTNIPTDKIEAIATALTVTPAYLMGWETPISIEETYVIKNDMEKYDLWGLHKDYEKNPHHNTTNLIKLYNQLTESQKKAIYELLKSITEKTA